MKSNPKKLHSDKTFRKAMEPLPLGHGRFRRKVLTDLRVPKITQFLDTVNGLRKAF